MSFHGVLRPTFMPEEPEKFGQFPLNEQVRVVTRSFHPAWGGGSTFVSAAALSQDECIIAKTAVRLRGGFAVLSK